MNHLTAAEMIAIKRDGGALDQQMIEDIVLGITNGSLSDAQVGAFAMAVRIRGMKIDETVMLTDAMRRSGTNISWQLDGPVVDKHSTGGVGDKVDPSTVIAQVHAATEDAADVAEKQICAAISVSETSIAPRTVLIGD